MKFKPDEVLKNIILQTIALGDCCECDCDECKFLKFCGKDLNDHIISITINTKNSEILEVKINEDQIQTTKI